ncbi:hypothetical protein [Maridesulfovibrio ferrireducens]|uniref:hypothetical protein n=1 Tax=Maridesulfovibrio ferrireducens TaxID=246191 RepID=UPI001A334EAD|nr:hypothetical protein [Maridesulfovibrio ferrireducens]MBI9112217.1 hypothetical protein [Maridesulfovibrio ferrireducens]
MSEEQEEVTYTVEIRISGIPAEGCEETVTEIEDMIKMANFELDVFVSVPEPE